jgi:hypothetical protein
LTPVKKKAMKIENPKHLVCGYNNGSGSSDSTDMNDEEED